MEEVKVFYNRAGNTLTVWFGNPEDEVVCEETGDEIVLMKDKNAKRINPSSKLYGAPRCFARQECRTYLRGVGATLLWRNHFREIWNTTP